MDCSSEMSSTISSHRIRRQRRGTAGGGATLRDLLGQWARKVDVAGLVDDAADSIRLAQLPALSGRLLDIESETRIDETTQVKRRAEVEYEMGIESNRIGSGCCSMAKSSPSQPPPR